MSIRLFFTSVFICTIGLAASPASAESSIVTRCQSLERDFDFDAVLRECSASASDTRLPKAERLIFLRLLGIAHASLGDEEKAKLWFQQLLMLNPEFEMSGAQSPRLISTFRKAKDAFKKDGRVVVTHTPPPAPTSGQATATKLSFIIEDKLSQVVRGQVVLQMKKEDGTPEDAEPLALVKGELDAEGRTLWSANLPPPTAMLVDTASVVVTYSVRLMHSGGGEIKNRTPAASHTLRFEAGAGESNLFPILIGAAGVGVAAVAIAGGAGAFLFWCTNDPSCLGPTTHPNLGTVQVDIAIGAIR